VGVPSVAVQVCTYLVAVVSHRVGGPLARSQPTRPCGAQADESGLCYLHRKQRSGMQADLHENGWRSLAPILDADRGRESDLYRVPMAPVL
jgi:hypothetical protein